MHNSIKTFKVEKSIIQCNALNKTSFNQQNQFIGQFYSLFLLASSKAETAPEHIVLPVKKEPQNSYAQLTASPI